MSIRRACIRLLEEYADDKNTKVDLRKLWRGDSGSQTKKTMIDDPASDFNDVFNDTARFNPRPSNWARASRAVAAQCFVLANGQRSRDLPAAKPRGDQSPTPSVVILETPRTESVSATSVSLSRQPVLVHTPTNIAPIPPPANNCACIYTYRPVAMECFGRAER